MLQLQYQFFIGKIAVQIDAAVAKKIGVIMMGVYNISQSNLAKHAKIDTVLTQCNLTVTNNLEPTTGDKNNNCLINYIIKYEK